MERGEAFVRKREPGVVVMDGRIDQDFRMGLKVGKGGIVVQLVVEDLHHNIRAGEVGEPIAKDVLREKPPANPTALKIVAQGLADHRSGKCTGLVSESVVYGRERSTGHAGNHIDLFEQTSLSEI